MKNKMKIMCSAILGVLLIGAFYSCSDDEGHYSYYRGMATVHVNDEGYAESFILDEGEKLFVGASETSYKPVSERVIIAFDLMDEKKEGFDHVINLRGYYLDVLTKPVIYVAEDDIKHQDSIGYNKIKVFSIWATPEYINIRFGYNRSNTSRHMVNLVTAIDGFEQTGDEPIKLQFRHNVVEGEELYASDARYVSFSLKDYIKANQGKVDKLTFEVEWEEYSGKVKTEILKIDLPTELINPPGGEN